MSRASPRDDFNTCEDECSKTGNSPKRRKKNQNDRESEEPLAKLKENLMENQASSQGNLNEDNGIWIVRRVHDDSSEEEEEKEKKDESSEAGDNIETDKVERKVTSCELASLNRAVKHMCLHEAAEEKRFLNVFHGSFPDEDINRGNANGETPLHFAAEIGSVGIVELLLDKGADPNVADSDGFTPLILAANVGHVSIVESLLTGQADVNYQDDLMGMTALHFAAYMGHQRVVEVLLEADADPLIGDFDGYLPSDYAASRWFDDVERLLSDAERQRDPEQEAGEEEIDGLVYATDAG